MPPGSGAPPELLAARPDVSLGLLTGNFEEGLAEAAALRNRSGVQYGGLGIITSTGTT